MTELGEIRGTLTLDGRGYFVTLDKAERETRQATTRIDRAFGRLPRPVQRAGRAVSRFTVRIRDAGRQARSATQNLQKAGRGFVAIQAAVGAAAAAFGGFKLVGLAGQVANADASFRSLSRVLGSDSTVALERFREAAGGTVSDLSLIESVNRGVILGVGNSVDDFEKLIDAARRLGRATGRTAAEGLEDLTTGIGRQSKLILDNLGLLVSIEKGNRNYAEANNIVGRSLTDQEKRAAFLEETLRAVEDRLKILGDEGDNFADTLNRFRAGFANFAAELARNVTPALDRLLVAIGGVGEGFGSFADLFGTVLSAAINNVAAFFEQNGKSISEIIGGLVQVFGQLSLTLIEIAKGVGELFSGLLTAPVETIEKRFGALFDGLVDIVVGFGKAAGAGLAEGLLTVLAPVLQDLAESFQGIWGVPKDLGERVRGALDEASLEFGRIRSAGVDQGIGGVGTSFLEGLLGIDPEEQQNLFTQFKAIEEQVVNFFGDIETASKTVDVSPDQATKAFEQIKEVLGFTEEQLASAGSALSSFQALLQTLRVAESAGTFRVEGIEAAEFEEVTRKLEAAQKRRVELVRQETEEARKTVKENEALNKLVTDLGTQLEQVTEQLDIVNLPEQERQLQTLRNEYERQLGGLQLADPEQLAKARRIVDQLIGKTRILLDAESARTQAARDKAKADADQLAAQTQIASLREQLIKDADESGVELRLLNKETEADVAAIDGFIADVRAEIDKIRIAKPEDVQELERLLEVAVMARREVDKVQENIRQQQASSEAASIVADFDAEAAAGQINQFEAARRDLSRALEEAQVTIRDLELDPKAEQEFIDQLNRAASQIKVQIDQDETRENIQPLVDSVTTSLESAANSFVRALANGRSAAEAIGQALAGQLQASLNQTFDAIRSSLSDTFTTVFDGISDAAGKALAGIFSAAIGIIGAIIARANESGSDFTEADIDEAATSSSVVRGVVAGPTSIPVAEVGSALRESFRTTEGLLRSILTVLENNAAGGLGDPLGTGQGAVTT